MLLAWNLFLKQFVLLGSQEARFFSKIKGMANLEKKAIGMEALGGLAEYAKCQNILLGILLYNKNNKVSPETPPRAIRQTTRSRADWKARVPLVTSPYFSLTSKQALSAHLNGSKISQAGLLPGLQVTQWRQIDLGLGERLLKTLEIFNRARFSVPLFDLIGNSSPGAIK